MKVVVSGSREWKLLAPIYDALKSARDKVGAPNVTVIHGGARGADQLAAKIARTLGMEVIEVPALWEKYGRAAGALRNIKMLDEHKPDLVLAFCLDGSRGTMHTVEEAMKRHIPVNLYSRWSEDRDRHTC